MQLLFYFSSNKLNYVVLFLALTFIGNVKTATNDASKLPQPDNIAPIVVLEQKSVKKELKEHLEDKANVVIASPEEKGDRTEKMVLTDKKYVTEKSGKGLTQKADETSGIFDTATKSKVFEPPHHQHFSDEDFVLDDDVISESLKTGFYFFLILSSGAIVFILFKIYRLRLSRAERKYGVQGDRSTQELTPLPISIEDDQSDDEDQTLFDIQRQNIGIF